MEKWQPAAYQFADLVNLFAAKFVAVGSQALQTLASRTWKRRISNFRFANSNKAVRHLQIATRLRQVRGKEVMGIRGKFWLDGNHSHWHGGPAGRRDGRPNGRTPQDSGTPRHAAPGEQSLRRAAHQPCD